MVGLQKSARLEIQHFALFIITKKILMESIIILRADNLAGTANMFDFSHQPLLFAALLLVFLAGYVHFAFLYVLPKWKEIFSGKKLTRCCKHSPSNKQPPSVTSWKQHRDCIVHNSSKNENFGLCAFIKKVINLEVPKREGGALTNESKQNKLIESREERR